MLVSTFQVKALNTLYNYKKKKIKIYIGLGISAAILVISGIVMAVILVMGAFGVLTNQKELVPTSDYSDINISEIGENQIPAEYIPLYKKAAEKYKLPWTLLASIHRIETRFSSIKKMESNVGAQGPAQFMPCTWVGWGHPSCSGLGKGNIPKSQMSDLKTIKKYGGYGVDANGDGKADIWDLEDSIYSAANYLAASGAAKGDFQKAIFAYNNADWYVQEVIQYMDLYGSGKAEEVNFGNMNPGKDKGPEAAEKAIKAGLELVGKSPYNWGGGRNQFDINRRSFDCSSFVHWMYAQGGVNLGDVSSVVTDSLVKFGKKVDAKDMKRGDLVFFDTYKTNGHVGIYLGDGKFLNDNSSHGVQVDKMNNTYWRAHFSGVVRRVVN
ncbi:MULTISPECIES: C40 family peptidase [Bacillus subtilis group]|uniref:C40 family peptidase n=1 Tax=Bacillus subtilis group TaxID=653685 RepID=UPI0023AAF25A|nr:MULTISPECIES: bifunctional lytic transglycosylase/C40 family peptidase [Bacillus subtilis group]WRU08180.1 bifunctional lytic transglycosylase/C40 family peptidase [Bacillus subtilis]